MLELRTGVVSVLRGLARVVLQRGKWKAVESSAEQGCKLLLFSQFFTSSLWFAHQRWPPSAALSTPSFIPLLVCHIHFLFSPLSSYFFPISSPIYPHSFTQISFHRLLPIASPLSYTLTPSLHFNLGGVPVASICIAATHWRWVWTA